MPLSQNVVTFSSLDNLIFLSVHLDTQAETVWLNLNQIAELFDRDKSVISRHLKKILASAELDKDSVVAKNATTASDGKTYKVEYFNLDAILAVGYRVNSKRGIHQTFSGQLLYPSVYERAAHLFYFTLKDHPFVDGNKRIGSFLLLLYLAAHTIQLSHITNESLIALALLVAQSNPNDKEMIIKLILNLITKEESC
jgi:prophage maintenance system killer protein